MEAGRRNGKVGGWDWFLYDGNKSDLEANADDAFDKAIVVSPGDLSLSRKLAVAG